MDYPLLRRRPSLSSHERPPRASTRMCAPASSMWTSVGATHGRRGISPSSLDRPWHRGATPICPLRELKWEVWRWDVGPSPARGHEAGGDRGLPQPPAASAASSCCCSREGISAGGRIPCPISTSTGFPELPLLNPHFPSSTCNLYQDLQGAYAGAIHVSSVIGGSLSRHRL
jgi:hypothetical protein